MLTREEIMGTIRTLAKGQGFYGRLLANLNRSTEEELDAFVKEINDAGVKDVVDLVMYLEG